MLVRVPLTTFYTLMEKAREGGYFRGQRTDLKAFIEDLTKADFAVDENVAVPKFPYGSIKSLSLNDDTAQRICTLVQEIQAPDDSVETHVSLFFSALDRKKLIPISWPVLATALRPENVKPLRIQQSILLTEEGAAWLHENLTFLESAAATNARIEDARPPEIKELSKQVERLGFPPIWWLPVQEPKRLGIRMTQRTVDYLIGKSKQLQLVSNKSSSSAYLSAIVESLADGFLLVI